MTLYKLTHDRRFDSVSPATVLAMPMMERVIDTEMIVQIGFVVGDAPYKSRWASERAASAGASWPSSRGRREGRWGRYAMSGAGR